MMGAACAGVDVGVLGHHGGFTAVEVTPQGWMTRYFQVEDPENADSAVNEVASFVVEAGQPGVQLA